MSETHAQDELKPCPFCGSVDVFVQNAGWWANTFMRCLGCQTTFALDNGTPRAHADTVAAWNRRAALQADPEYLTGWKLVPVEITLEMKKAYFDVIDKNMPRIEKDARFGRFDSNREAYQAMLAASPPPEYLSGQEAVTAKKLFTYTRTFDAIAAAIKRSWSGAIIVSVKDFIEAFGPLATPDLKAGKAEVTAAQIEAAAIALAYGDWDDLPETGEGFEGPGGVCKEFLRDDAKTALEAALNPGAPK